MRIGQHVLNLAYKDTCEATRVSLNGGLANEKGERANVAFAVISRLQDHGSNFSASLLHADGGVRRFVVTYRFGEYKILVSEFDSCQSDWPFGNVWELRDWLNKQERKIIITAAALLTQG